jgi:hypothetical protein
MLHGIAAALQYARAWPASSVQTADRHKSGEYPSSGANRFNIGISASLFDEIVKDGVLPQVREMSLIGREERSATSALHKIAKRRPHRTLFGHPLPAIGVSPAKSAAVRQRSATLIGQELGIKPD